MTKKTSQPLYAVPMDSASDESHIPYYKRLGNLILQDISTGRLQQGDRLLSERELARLHGLNVGTVRKALKCLYDQKMLYRIHGKGTFVRSMMSPESTALFYPFAPEPSQNPAPSIDLITKVEVIGLDLVPSPDEVKRAMGDEFKDEICRVSRLIYMNDEPKVLAHSYLASSYCEPLKNLPLNEFKTNSLFVIFHKHFKVRTTTNREFLSAAIAQENEAGKLKVPQGSPVLRIDSISFDQHDAAFEYRVGFCNTLDDYLTRTVPISF